jgi:hypothetical protein
MAAFTIQRRWIERPDRAAPARAVIGIPAVVNFVGSFAAIALATTGEPVFWLLAAAYAFATGLSCAKYREAPAVSTS